MYSRPLVVGSCHPYWTEDLVKDHTVARNTEEECLEAAVCKGALITAAEMTIDMVTEMTTDMDLEAEEVAMDLLEVEVEAGQVGSGLGWRIGILRGVSGLRILSAGISVWYSQAKRHRTGFARRLCIANQFHGSS